jgi:hypothetical protein
MSNTQNDNLSDTIIAKLQQSTLCQLLYEAYTKAGNYGSFEAYANECWRCYKKG